MRLNPSIISGVGLIPIPWLNNQPLPATGFEHYGLRDYQINLIERISHAMAMGYKRIVVVLPTGGGKTHVARVIIAECIARAYESMFLVHRREILKQTAEKFSDFSQDMGFILPNVPIERGKLLQMASTATLSGRLHLINKPRLAVIDEGHHSVATSWRRITDFCDDSYLICLTATPERLDGRGLREAGYEIIVEGPSVAELMAAGHLVGRYEYYGPDAPDPKSLHFGTAKFNNEAAAYAAEPKIVGSVVKHYLKYAAGKQGIVFAQNINHSLLLEQAFLRAGVRAKHVDGKTEPYLREKYDDDFRSERLDLLLNVGLFDEGYDVPNISYVGIGRISDSLAFHRQALGRGMRPFAGKECAYFCDHAGNWQRGLGLPDTPVKWSLDGHKKGKRGCVSGAVPVKQCPHCFMIMDSHHKTCSRCGYEFPVKMRSQIRQDKTAQLVEIRKEMAAAMRRMSPEEKLERRKEEGRCQTYADFVRLGRKRHYPAPENWATVKMRYRPREKAPPASLDEMDEL